MRTKLTSTQAQVLALLAEQPRPYRGARSTSQAAGRTRTLNFLARQKLLDDCFRITKEGHAALASGHYERVIHNR